MGTDPLTTFNTLTIFLHMDSKTFFIRLSVVTAATSALLVLLHIGLSEAQMHWKFAVASVLLFAVVCIGLFFAGASAIRSSNKYAFNNLVSVSVFGKMVLAMIFLFAYQRVLKPQNEWFVAIFLVSYVTYTIFEVWFMTRIAKMKG